MDQPIGLMLIIAVLSIWLQQYWLAAVMAVVLGLVLFSNVEVRSPIAAPAGGKVLRLAVRFQRRRLGMTALYGHRTSWRESAADDGFE